MDPDPVFCGRSSIFCSQQYFCGHVQEHGHAERNAGHVYEHAVSSVGDKTGLESFCGYNKE